MHIVLKAYKQKPQSKSSLIATEVVIGRDAYNWLSEINCLIEWICLVE